MRIHLFRFHCSVLVAKFIRVNHFSVYSLNFNNYFFIPIILEIWNICSTYLHIEVFFLVYFEWYCVIQRIIVFSIVENSKSAFSVKSRRNIIYFVLNALNIF